MPRRAEKLRPDWLLCERCGYRLDGIDHDDPCPECGKPIAESLPECRPGSKWQRKPGFIAYLATDWTTVRHPWTRWDAVRPRPTTGLLAMNCAAIGAALAVGLGAPDLLDGNGEIFGLPALLVLVAPFVLFSLSKTEALGLRVLGARNRWRITPDIAAAVIAHASIGWLLALPVLIAEIAYFRWIGSRAAMAWLSAPWWWEALAWAAAPLAGLVGFETLAWLGWRRMKFANRTAPNPIEEA